MARTKIQNVFKPISIPKAKAGSVGFDNSRENIDPHVKTKVVSTKELTLSDGSAAGVVQNDASGVLSGGHAAGGGDVTAAANLTDVKIVQGDGGAKGIKTSTVSVTDVANNTTHRSSNGQNHADVVSNNTHRADNTQAHSDYLVNNANDTTTGILTAAAFITTGPTITGDHGTAATDQVVNVCYGTGSEPAANTTTIGTLWIKYTA